MLHAHPACQIPALPLDAPCVLTEPHGGLRPERCIIKNQSLLLLWHFAGSHDGSGRVISSAEYAGLEKTADRLITILRQADRALNRIRKKQLANLEATYPYFLDTFVVLHWPEAEQIFFTVEPFDEAEAAMSKYLIQCEQLRRTTLQGTDVLEFDRC